MTASPNDLSISDLGQARRLGLASVHQSIIRLRQDEAAFRARGSIHNLIDAEIARAMADARELTLQQLGLPLHNGDCPVCPS